MHVLVILKYIPDPTTERKSDSLWSVMDGLAAAGIKITLATKGRSAPHTFAQVDHSDLVRYLENPGVEKNPFPAGLPSISLAICTSEYPALLAQKIKRSLSIPYVVREHRNCFERDYLTASAVPEKLRSAFREASAVYAVSSPLARTMEQRGVREVVGVLPNSLPDGFFHLPKATKSMPGFYL